MFISICNIEMNVIKLFKNLCIPAKVYFLYSVLSSLIQLFIAHYYPQVDIKFLKKAAKAGAQTTPKELHFVTKVFYPSMQIFFFFVTLFYTYIIQFLCKKGHKKLTWVIVGVLLLPGLIDNLALLFNKTPSSWF